MICFLPEWPSHPSMHQNHGGLIKHKFAGLRHRFLDPVGLGWCSRIFSSNKLPGDSDADVS